MRRRSNSGQATLEFALSSIVLLLILLGLVDFSRVFYFNTGLHAAAREGARHGSWFDTPTRTNPYLYDSEIKVAVDQTLLGVSGISASVFKGNCPGSTDGNPYHNPPYDSGAFPPAGTYNAPYLYICYGNNGATDITAAPGNNNYRLTDINVILLMNYGLATGFMQDQIGSSIRVAANTHMYVSGKI